MNRTCFLEVLPERAKKAILPAAAFLEKAWNLLQQGNVTLPGRGQGPGTQHVQVLEALVETRANPVLQKLAWESGYLSCLE